MRYQNQNSSGWVKRSEPATSFVPAASSHAGSENSDSLREYVPPLPGARRRVSAPTGIAWALRALLGLALLGLAGGSEVFGQAIGAYRQIYAISGSSLNSLTNAANSSFPNNPTGSETLTNFFETPYNYGENFGDRIRALLVPPVSGTYVFWTAGDDAAALFLSIDESAFNKGQIAYNTQTALYRMWFTHPGQQSTNIYLEAGRRYYIEGLHSAGTGDDAYAVGWKLPDGTLELPIPAMRLRPFGSNAVSRPALTSQPASLTLAENATAIFRVGVSNLDAVSYQWMRNGALMPGVVGASHVIALAGPGDHGASFQCQVSNVFGTVTSSAAVLTVVADTTRPVLFTAGNLTSNSVQIVFNEPVEPATGTNAVNYFINNNVAITAATLGDSPRTIILTTSTLARGNNYTVTVSNVRDRSVARNAVVAGSQFTFTALLKGVFREMFSEIPGSFLGDLTNNPGYPNSPSSANLLTDYFETSDYAPNNYGQRLRARLLPPVTGNYTFWLSAHDVATLILGTNNNSSSGREIASVTPVSGVSARQWDVQANQRSVSIPLVAGQQYYMEAAMKAGISTGFPADHLAVRWQLPDGSMEEPISVSRLTPFGMNPPQVSIPPAPVTVVEGSAATFAVTVSNVDPLAYQWQRNGTNLVGETNATYTDAQVAYSLNGSTYRCVLNNAIGSTNSAGALLTVNPDVTRPLLTNVVNSSSNRVVVYFSEPIEGATAGNAANYVIPGIVVSSPVLAANQRSVTLTTTPLIYGNNYTITVNRVRDRAAIPNVLATNAQMTFVASEFFLQDIGSPPAGSISFVSGGIDVLSGDGNISGTNDQFTFSFQERRGDFDVKVRVQRLDYADAWTTAGLMAREDLGTNSRFAAVFSTPSLSGSFFQYRSSTGGVAQSAGSFPANYPYTWLRLKRDIGTIFTGYASFDGETWTKLGSVTLDFGVRIYLGFSTTSHRPAQKVLTQFRDYSEVVGGTIGELPVAREPLGPSSRRTGLVISEIMYHPAERADGKKLEFVELYNSNPFFEDISGFRLSGDIDYTFPAGTIFSGGSFLVVARNPADIQSVFGIPNVTGPYTNNLSNKNGTVRLRNRSDALLLEVNYDSKPPWPAAADGAGHSIVLTHASYGEASDSAWSQSDRIGGSPGLMDGVEYGPLRNIVINEFLAHTDLPELDYVELYNHGNVAVNLSGCWLTDDPTTNKFRIPDGTILGPAGFVVFNETTMGFSLAAGGETLFLISSNRVRVLDSITFDGQENGVATGRSPDGAPSFNRLASKTPGATNAPVRVESVVINEIMYHPVSDDDALEYVELHNRGTGTVNLTNWRLKDGIDFTLPTNTVIAANGYLVVAKNALRLRANYNNLSAANTVGDFTGSLANSGERITLDMPDTVVSTNLAGVVSTNLIHIEVDDVTYGTGGRWGKWSDGGGSSLELIDPRSDNRLAPNWTDSDDTAKSAWTTLSVTGPMDNGVDGQGDWNSLQIILLDEGECLVDDVDVRIDGSVNLVTNGTFTTSMQYWYPQGTHRNTFLDPTGFSGRSMHVVSTDRGDTGANRIYTLLADQYTTNSLTGTLAAKVKWLHGRPEILFRLRGNVLEIPGKLTVPLNLGTPGLRNSRWATNAGPAITDVAHSPVLPAPSQPIVVTARVHDADGLSLVQLTYRVTDPFGSSTSVGMVDNGTGGDAVAGDGLYAATIPGQPNDSITAFYVTAIDRFSPAVTTRFPNNAPTRECLIHIGSEERNSAYGTYRFWLTAATLNAWSTREKFSNEPYEGTFVYGDFRIIYNAASHYAGSPAHTKLYDTPIGTNCDYQLTVPADDQMLNETSMRVQQPGLSGRDDTGQNEQIGYWIGNQLNIPFLHRRAVHMFINGVRRGMIYEDTQRPTSSFDEQWYPNAVGSDLYKVGYWYEFGDDTTKHDNFGPSLVPFLTTNGATVVKKLARYRQTFYKRAVKDSVHNYTNLFQLVDAMNTTATGEVYMAQMAATLDIKEWARSFAVERIINNTDLYGAKRLNGDITKPGGQNSFLFKAAGDTWKFLIWDIDAAYLGTPVDPLFDFTDPPISNLFSQPYVLRTYWQALQDAADGPLVPAILHPLIDAKYEAYQAAGIPASPADNIKVFLSVRRDYILQLLSDVRAGFAITSNGGNGFTNASTLVMLSGTAPIGARVITINGVEYPLIWSSITNWTARLALNGQTNVFDIRAHDQNGQLLANGSRSITVYFNGPVTTPENGLAISEIMYMPVNTNASYVEIFNRSTNTTFDLSTYRLNGLSLQFDPGTILAPRSYAVVVKNILAFQAAYGTNAMIAGVFEGSLDRGGETVSLIKRALSTNEVDVVVDRVKYEAVAPWMSKAAATNSGAALQLIDSVQDNARVSNWDDGSGWHYYTYTARPSSSSSPRFYVWLDAAGEVYIDDIRLVQGTVAGVGSNYVRNGDFETPLLSPWLFTGTPGNSTNSSAYAKSGTNSLRLIFTKAGGTSTCLYQDPLGSSSSSTDYTLSFWYRPVTNASGTNLTVRYGSSSSSFSTVARLKPVTATPGTSNWVSGTVTPYPLLWINEVGPNNLSGYQDNTGTPQPWVELFNSGTNAISLDGMYLSASYSNLLQWPFPAGTSLAPGEFRVIFTDGRPQFTTPTVLHTSFRLDPTNGSIVLSRGQQILDYINYAGMESGYSRGSIPDGQLFNRQIFYFLTPGSSNNPSPAPVVFNEWMASNTRTLTNPVTFTYEDWFELYNFGAAPVNLSGFFLTDNLNNPKMWRIPDGTIVAPHDFLFCWADGDLTGTNLVGNALHTNFKLSRNGGEIGLFSPDGLRVDGLAFDFQYSDVSQGRYADGNTTSPFYFMPTPTPRANNIVTNNVNAPILAFIPNRAVSENQLLSFTCSATDADGAAQTLAYSLSGEFPDGAGIHPVSGQFTWTPGEAHGPGSYSITVQATDSGDPALSDAKTFQVTVNEVNTAPTLAFVPDQQIDSSISFNLQLVGADSDLPAQTLIYDVLVGPPGATVDASGRFSWTPGTSQPAGSNSVVVRVTDNGSPALSAVRTFTIAVTSGSACLGYKADVTGTNGRVTQADWVLVGRFYAQLSEPTNNCQRALADCGRRVSGGVTNWCGDGNLGLSDWVQAGRYAAVLDEWTSMADCPPPGFAPAGLRPAPDFQPASVFRTLFVTNSAIEQGQSGCVRVLLDAFGDENALGFSLSYDTNRLTLVSVTRSAGADGTLFNTNIRTRGFVAISLAQSPGDVFPAALLELAEVCFQAKPGTNVSSTPIRIVDQPLAREVLDPDVNPLSANFQNGTVVITHGGDSAFEGIGLPGANGVKLRLIGQTGLVWDLQGSADLEHWESISTQTNVNGLLEFADPAATHSPHRFYRAVKP